MTTTPTQLTYTQMGRATIAAAEAEADAAHQDRKAALLALLGAAWFALGLYEGQRQAIASMVMEVTSIDGELTGLQSARLMVKLAAFTTEQAQFYADVYGR